MGRWRVGGKKLSAREEILQRLQSQARPEVLPPAWTSGRSFADLEDRFAAALEAAHGEVRRAPDLEGAWKEVDTILGEVGARAVVANGEPPLDEALLRQRWPACEWHVVGQTEGDLRAFCVGADVGLSGVEAALAETGTVVVSSGPQKSRMATLLPPLHLALVPRSCLLPDLFTWTAGRNGAMPANRVFISGPSKTADIEFTLTLGVHGPGRVVVVLYD